MKPIEGAAFLACGSRERPETPLPTLKKQPPPIAADLEQFIGAELTTTTDAPAAAGWEKALTRALKNYV